MKNFFRNLCTYIHNIFFTLKYPFWKSRNVWTGKFSGYKFTWYDDIPEGWQKAFGKQLSEDIKKAFKKAKKHDKKLTWKKAISFQQIKEKWGYLCLYASAVSEIREVLDKYEKLSIDYCIICGKPSEYCTEGWISYLCKSCFAKNLNYKLPKKELIKYVKSCKIKK